MMRETLGYDKNHEDREKDDYYATDPKEVKNILSREQLYGTILENSCGEGHIAKEIEKQYPHNKLIATDLIDRGYGEGGLNFLDDDYPYTDNVNTIIMNPPFKLIREFVVKSLDIAMDKVVLFARLQFVESQDRYNHIFKDKPPHRIYIYVDRVRCAKDGDFENYTTSNMAFAWFIWDYRNSNEGVKWIRKYDKTIRNKLI